MPAWLAGVSYGLTQQLYNFWRKGQYLPLYLRQSASETTGEHTLVMVRPLEHPEVQGTEWLKVGRQGRPQQPSCCVQLCMCNA